MKDVSALPGTDLPASDEAFGKRVLSKVAWRLIPLLGVLYIFNILDRVNVGFAALTMRKDLGIKGDGYSTNPSWRTTCLIEIYSLWLV